MKRSTRGYLALAALGSVFAVHLSGCSVLFGTAGLILDNASAEKPRVIPAERIATIQKGQELSVLLADGRTVNGVLSGRARLGRAEYAAKYDAWRAAAPEGAHYPALGESVELVRADGQRTPGAFAGFGFRSVLLEGDDPEKPREHPFADMVALSAGGRAFGADSLAASALASKLPSRDALELVVSRGPTAGDPRVRRTTPRRSSVTGEGTMLYRIPTDEARQLTLYRPGRAALAGFLVGLTLDAATLAAFATWNGPFGDTGCRTATFSRNTTNPAGTAWDPRTGRAAPRGAH